MKKDPVLIFDFDGTIADTFHYLVRIGNRLSEEFDFNKIDPDEIRDMKDKNIRETIEHLNIPLLKIPMIVAKAKKELHKEIESVEPITGLKEILLQIKSLGHKMGILTSNSSKNVMGFLENNGLDFFDFICTTSKIWSKNGGLKTLMDEHGLELSEVIYVGDETRDIKAAKKAGIRSAAVTWGYNSCKTLEAQNPDYLIHSPKELFQLFI
ncbi:MAG: HAD-IA family hydrolase [Candidatus Omnitrophica bacterium]|nr:HAD-IA family hydrolase [Candidatus Omnitrophota bacterium]